MPNRDDATMPAPSLGRRQLVKVPGFPSPQGWGSSKIDTTSAKRAKATPIKFEWHQSTIRKVGSKHPQGNRPGLQSYFTQSPTSAIDDPPNMERLHANGMGSGGTIVDCQPALLVALQSATRRWLPTTSAKKLSSKQPTNTGPPVSTSSAEMLSDDRSQKTQLPGLRLQDVSRIALTNEFAVDAITLYFDDSTSSPECVVLDAIKRQLLRRQDHCHHRRVVDESHDWRSKMRCLQHDVEWYLR